jgi:enoyl-CoA hydratase
MSYELIEVRTEADKVGIITLHRPKQLNALNGELMVELGHALKAFDADTAIGCIIITGSDKAFAAGAALRAEGLEPPQLADIWQQLRIHGAVPSTVEWDD